uniref:BZIP domain-containing protein n=1 Tax=Glossina pallidipes TaxID=7398 RepID=A0A1B0AH61_GLOPL
MANMLVTGMRLYVAQVLVNVFTNIQAITYTPMQLSFACDNFYDVEKAQHKIGDRKLACDRHHRQFTKYVNEESRQIIDSRIEKNRAENFYTPFQSLDNSLEDVVGISTHVAKVQAPVNVTNFSLPNSTPEVSILTQLTPPSSPPQSFASPVQHHSPASVAPVPSASTAENNLPLNFSDVFHHVSESTSLTTSAAEANQSEFVFAANWNNNTQSSLPAASPLSEDELAREMQIVDDILKSAAEELFDETESQSSVSLAPSQTDDITTDDEWLPSSGGSSPAQTSAIDSLSSSNKVNKKRTRPYGRAPEDRKIRKKEQNKNAATRYRQKKKLEMENVLVEEQDLVQRNDELNRQLTEHKREAKYLKKLIREFYKDKFSN